MTSAYRSSVSGIRSFGMSRNAETPRTMTINTTMMVETGLFIVSFARENFIDYSPTIVTASPSVTNCWPE